MFLLILMFVPSVTFDISDVSLDANIDKRLSVTRSTVKNILLITMRSLNAKLIDCRVILMGKWRPQTYFFANYPFAVRMVV